MTQVVETAAGLQEALAGYRGPGGRVALVPTMGALHEGHLSLVAAARDRLGARHDAVVVSVFVNPTQFGAGEDLERYPRTIEADLALLEAAEVEVVFVPGVEQMYPHGDPAVSVHPGPLGSILEGAIRPTHFTGVLTVVAKLLGLSRPDLGVFGEKDYQQLMLITSMVAELCLGVDVVGAPIVRERDGLALSSRNRFLSPEERETALGLVCALRAGVAAQAHGAGAVRRAARDALAAAGLTPDYVAVTGPMLDAAPQHGAGRLLLAAPVGSTRLIDNVAVSLGRD